jgi:CrcB protein
MKQAIPAYAASGTLIVNVIGSLAIGYLLGTAHDAKSMSEQMRLFLVVGILGGLTTFSSLAHETVSLAHHPDSSITHSLGHLTANIVLGLGAVWVGVWLRGGLSSAE